ncbi:MAG: hypothetical protein QOH91_3570 [Mycobacterium sp.]|jgi:hypothetical protein|nr:hypothetical protein [Mycobacterium sp.]
MPAAATTFQQLDAAIGYGYGKSHFAAVDEVAARAAAIPRGIHPK